MSNIFSNQTLSGTGIFNVQENTERLLTDLDLRLENYYTKNQSDNRFILTTQGYTRTQVDNLLTSKANVSDLEGLATESFVNQAIENIPQFDSSGIATEQYVDDAISNIPPPDLSGKLDTTGGILSGDLDMGDNRIFNIQNIYTKAQSDEITDDLQMSLSQKLNLVGGTMQGNLHMNGNEVTGISNIYTKLDVDGLLDNLDSAILERPTFSDVYTQEQTDNLIEGLNVTKFQYSSIAIQRDAGTPGYINADSSLNDWSITPRWYSGLLWVQFMDGSNNIIDSSGEPLLSGQLSTSGTGASSSSINLNNDGFAMVFEPLDSSGVLNQIQNNERVFVSYGDTGYLVTQTASSTVGSRMRITNNTESNNMKSGTTRLGISGSISFFQEYRIEHFTRPLNDVQGLPITLSNILRGDVILNNINHPSLINANNVDFGEPNAGFKMRIGRPDGSGGLISPVISKNMTINLKAGSGNNIVQVVPRIDRMITPNETTTNVLINVYNRSEIDNLLQEKADVSMLNDFVDEAFVSNAISNIPPFDASGLATEQYVDTAISNIPPFDSSGLATETYVDNAISGLATETYVDTSISNIDFSPYPQISYGTWTPQLRFGSINGGNVGMTGEFNGHYTLIGDICFMSGRIILSDKGTSQGNARIDLPYQCKDLTPQAGFGITFGEIQGIQNSKAGLTAGRILNSATVAPLVYHTHEPGGTFITYHLTEADFISQDVYLTFSAFYRIA